MDQKIKQILIKIAVIARNHKKKLIFIIVVPSLIYLALKKMTMEHFIIVIQKISNFAEYLPLPSFPQRRNLSQYQHFQLSPLSQILTTMQVDDIRQKINKRQLTIADLKQEIFSGACLGTVLYNVQTLYFNVQNKYKDDFNELQALTQFDNLMHNVRKKFTEEIPQVLNFIKNLLFYEIQKLPLKKMYSCEELQQAYKCLISKIFEPKFTISQKIKQKINQNTKVNNLFTTTNHELKQNKTKSKYVSKFFSGISTVVSTFTNLLELLPQPKEETTRQRFSFIKNTHILSLKKTNTNIEWPNRDSEELSKKVLQQMTYTLQSLNFHILVKQYARLNIKILVNRIKIYFKKADKEQIQLNMFLPILYKIIREEFLGQKAMNNREKFYESQLKKNFKLMNTQEKQDQQKLITKEEQLSLSILQEIYLKNSFEHLQKDFQVKYFNQRSGITLKAKTQKQNKNESQQMQKLLSMLGGSEQLNRAQ